MTDAPTPDVPAEANKPCACGDRTQGGTHHGGMCRPDNSPEAVNARLADHAAKMVGHKIWCAFASSLGADCNCNGSAANSEPVLTTGKVIDLMVALKESLAGKPVTGIPPASPVPVEAAPPAQCYATGFATCNKCGWSGEADHRSEAGMKHNSESPHCNYLPSSWARGEAAPLVGCREISPNRKYWCSLPPNHAGDHEAWCGVRPEDLCAKWPRVAAPASCSRQEPAAPLTAAENEEVAEWIASDKLRYAFTEPGAPLPAANFVQVEPNQSRPILYMGICVFCGETATPENPLVATHPVLDGIGITPSTQWQCLAGCPGSLPETPTPDMDVITDESVPLGEVRFVRDTPQ